MSPLFNSRKLKWGAKQLQNQMRSQYIDDEAEETDREESNGGAELERQSTSSNSDEAEETHRESSRGTRSCADSEGHSSGYSGLDSA